ncbi:armadillo-type protein [Mycena floridula]|nr:armadillo-type protein [Mycena floridula]
MPREIRKRGKKHKKAVEEYPEVYVAPAPVPDAETTAGPSWIVSAGQQEDSVNMDAPFGYVEVDVKAYFRTVDVQIRDWQSTEARSDDPDESDPNAERRMFFVAALTEMNGKEKQLATDPDCSVILERMCYSMDDFVRRVFLDSFTGSCETLMEHRYASHVFQTLFTLGAETVSRETRGILPPPPDSSEHGELRTFTQLEVLPNLHSLIMDPFASHVIRALLLLLAPYSTSSNGEAPDVLRSKRSASWKNRQDPMKSVFEKGKARSTSYQIASPSEFRAMANSFLEAFRKTFSDNELRALCIDKVASPVLHILLEVESHQEMSDIPASLLDRLTEGLVTAAHENPSEPVERLDFFAGLLLDQTSSHLVETIVTCSGDAVFSLLWATYFKGRLQRLAAHPVGNFVMAKALEKASAEQLSSALEECSGIWDKIISSLGVWGDVINQAIFQALGIVDDQTLLVPCMLRLQSLEDYTRFSQLEPEPQGYPSQSQDNTGPKVGGAVLLQALLRFPAPHNEPVIASIKACKAADILDMAKNPIASRVLDALLDSPTVPASAKRQFIVSLIDSFHLLVDDRIGSRVADRCWASSDTYLKKKIATALIPHEQFLAASYFGKFFSRNLNLYLLQRKPQDWMDMQSRQSQALKQSAAPVSNTPSVVAKSTLESTAKKEKKRKRKADAHNEIDDLFDVALGKKAKKGSLPSDASASKSAVNQPVDVVLGAIRAAPSHSGKKARS